MKYSIGSLEYLAVVEVVGMGYLVVGCHLQIAIAKVPGVCFVAFVTFKIHFNRTAQVIIECSQLYSWQGVDLHIQRVEQIRFAGIIAMILDDFHQIILIQSGFVIQENRNGAI